MGMTINPLAGGSPRIVPIPGYEKFYGATPDGRVYSFNYRRTGKTVELAQSTHPEGYKRVKAWHVRKSAGSAVHRMVAMAFIPNPLSLPQVNHIDGNKGNNSVENLEWVDNAGNQKHAFRIGLHVAKKGECHGMHKLTEQQVIEIRKELSEVKKYKGQLTDLGKKYGVSLHCIFDIKKGRSWL